MAFISIGIFIIALALIGYAAASYGGIKKIGVDGYDTPFKFEKNSLAFGLCLVGGVLALIVSILGCCTFKFKKWFITTPFVICTFIIALLALAAGAVVISADLR